MPLGSVNFTSAQDPELAAIERRRRMAELLAQQAGQPTQAPTNAPISPLSGLAKALRGYTAGSGLRKADEQEQQYNQSYQQELAKVLQGDPTGMSARAGQSQDPRIMALAAQLRIREAERQAETQAKQVTNLTDAEEKAAGLDPAGVYQKDAYGGIKPVWEPPKSDTKSAELLAQEKELYDYKARTDAANRAPIPPVGVQPVTIVGPDGKPVIIDARTGAKIGDAPTPGQGKALSATAQKELFEAEDVSAASGEAIATLNSILAKDPLTGKSQNDLAYEGATAGARTAAAQIIPGSSVATDATVDLKNKVTGQALESLKAVFGGMPTEGERKILLELQGSINMTAPQREAIFKRAIAAAERRKKRNEEKMQALRSGSYFSEQSQTDNGDGMSESERAELEQLRQELGQ